MPSSSRPVPVGATDDVWHRHEAQIKDLYQNKRKTLREVKRLMEENGFPETPYDSSHPNIGRIKKLQILKLTDHICPASRVDYRHGNPNFEKDFNFERRPKLMTGL